MDAIVVGAGLGGLSAALRLSQAGANVRVFEALPRAGGKAGITVVDGVEVDTGPSVVTLTEVFRSLYSALGEDLDDHITLRRLDPGFRYIYPDGVSLDVFHEPERTVQSVADTLGGGAANELRGFLAYTQSLWETASPHFIFQEAPSIRTMALLGPASLFMVPKLDPLRSMVRAIRARVKDERLRWLLLRYATYNGSDPRRAPATLNCIAHVELGLGGYGIEGGIYSLVRSMEQLARARGVSFHFDSPVEQVLVSGERAHGVRVAGQEYTADVVVVNADVGHLTRSLVDKPLAGLKPPSPRSTSGWTGIVRAKHGGRLPHTVVFPDRYEAEFEDLFDAQRPPQNPTVYACDQSQCHGRAAWKDGAPVFLMANAPALMDGEQEDAEAMLRLKEEVLQRAVASGVIQPGAELLWERTPAGLDQLFPGTGGALYGAASNGMWSAFKRPANRSRVRGLYLASGSAHPGGGMPLCVQSGRIAAEAALGDRKAS